MSINASEGKPPFDELREIIRAAGYEVVSIGVESLGSQVITLKIAPEPYLGVPSSVFMKFPQISRDLVAGFHKCAAQRHPQERGRHE